MEWLIKLVQDSKKNEDGSIDTEALKTSINAELPKHFIPKEKYNDISEQLKTANTTITDLKKNNQDNEALQNTIKDHEATIKNLEANAANTTKEYALKDKLRDLGVTDSDYIIYKHGGIDKFNFDKDGKVIGLEETITPYKESIPHIFKTDKIETQYNPAGGGTPASNNPFVKDTFNLTEQGKLLRENPARAKELASVAGITLNI